METKESDFNHEAEYLKLRRRIEALEYAVRYKQDLDKIEPADDDPMGGAKWRFYSFDDAELEPAELPVSWIRAYKHVFVRLADAEARYKIAEAELAKFKEELAKEREGWRAAVRQQCALKTEAEKERDALKVTVEELLRENSKLRAAINLDNQLHIVVLGLRSRLDKLRHHYADLEVVLGTEEPPDWLVAATACPRYVWERIRAMLKEGHPS
jgi:hypothetical protein